MYIWGFWSIFLVAQLPQKKSVLKYKNRLVSCQLLLSHREVTHSGVSFHDTPHVHSSEWDNLFLPRCLPFTNTIKISIEVLLFNSLTFSGLWTHYFSIRENYVVTVEEVSNHHGQEARHTVAYAASTPAEVQGFFGSRFLLCLELRKRRQQTAWKRKIINKSASCDVCVTCDKICWYLWSVLN